MSHKILVSARQALRQPAFIVVALILLVAAVGLNGATQFMQLHFKKLPVPLGRALTEVPQRLGPWVQVSIDESLDHDFQDVLGTDKYVFRDYVDSRLVSGNEMNEFKDKSPLERKRLVAALQMKNPSAVINVGLTYYTGLVDTVAHIPDRCYIADGYEPTKYELVSWDALKGKRGDQTLRYIVFEDQTPGRASVARNVAYFFQCNGDYVNNPSTVRTKLADLTDKYGYYMKVEVQTLKLAPDESARVMNDFLVQSLGEVEKCLPEWDKLTAAR